MFFKNRVFIWGVFLYLVSCFFGYIRFCLVIIVMNCIDFKVDRFNLNGINFKVFRFNLNCIDFLRLLDLI